MNKQLGQKHIEKLDSIGFIWDASEYLWNEGYEYLSEYVNNHEDSLVDWGYKTDSKFTLGYWVKQQRIDMLNNRLTLEQIDKLNNLSFVWDILKYLWDEGFEHLNRFVSANNNIAVPNKYVTNDGYPLGGWVLTQRSYKNKGKLTPYKINKLESINFIWDMREYRWHEGFEHLKGYIDTNGHCVVPPTYLFSDGYDKLKKWIDTQRSFKKQGKLSKERIEKLESLDEWVWVVRIARKG
jgi:hypothetical protein